MKTKEKFRLGVIINFNYVGVVENAIHIKRQTLLNTCQEKTELCFRNISEEDLKKHSKFLQKIFL